MNIVYREQKEVIRVVHNNLEKMQHQRVKPMTRDEAREYFKQKGLTYADINEEDIKHLVRVLSEELLSYLLTGGEHAQHMDMGVRKPLKKDVHWLKTKGLQYAYLKVKGSYFEKREAISFNQNGFIGFGGELDSKNVAPILTAFCKWCDTLVKA